MHFLYLFIKYIGAFSLFCYSFYKSISNIIFKIKSKMKLKKIKEFENGKTDDNESEIINFYDINSRNILLESNINYQSNSINPDVSIILLMFNQAKIIHTSLRSIQNQSLKKIEIIIIDDGSTDNSIKVVKKYLKHDKRIKLIKNKFNEGKIKSRSKGIRASKGKYITMIDGDDAFIHKNILYNSFYIAETANLDIVEFKIAKYNGHKFLGILTHYELISHIEDEVIFQPELRKKFIIRNETPYIRGILNRNICGKLIKNSIFQKVLLKLGAKYTELYMLIYEDSIMAISLLQIANSYYLMREKGYYYNRSKKYKNKINNNKCRSSKSGINVFKGLDNVKYLNFLFEHTKDNFIERQFR